jgi:hypothetical protein
MFGRYMSNFTDFNMDQLRLKTEKVEVSHLIKKAKRQGSVYWPEPGEQFLSGPIPRQWLLETYSLPGKAVVVALEVWHRARLTKSRTVRLNLSQIPNIRRDSARRGLQQLQKAKLVSVTRHLGRCPVVTILIKKPNKKIKRNGKVIFNGNGKESDMRGEKLS